MTDEPQGPGWWQASDRKWYPPERHPNYEVPSVPSSGWPPVPQPGTSDYPQQQHLGAQPSGLPSYGQPSEGIAVTAHMFGLVKLLKPKISIDGYEMPARWGRTVVPARPGRHHVHVHVPYFWPRRIGPADTVVEVDPGRVVELEYKAPVWQWSPGSLGAGPQSYNGIGIAITVNLLGAALLSIMLLTHSLPYDPTWFVVALIVALVVNVVVLMAKSGSKPKTGQLLTQQAATPPGWYPDPNDPNRVRYFDGRDWTSQTVPRG